MIGKRLKKAYSEVDLKKIYSLTEALELVKANAKAKFDETIEISVNLGIDTSKTDQNVRGIVMLPNGTGKVFRVAVFAQGEKAEEAKNAGADIVGADDLVEKINKGELNFDRCIATPDLMALVGRVAKILGPRGLMPNPKTGTVTVNVAAAIKAVKGGQVDFRSDKGGVVHAGVGKASFSVDALHENIKNLYDVLLKEKPAASKGIFIKKMSVSSTMGIGVQFVI